jgi:hypothetical protein
MTSAVRIVVQDPTGSGLGLAIGLVELGHAVTYRGTRGGGGSADAPTARLQRDLVRRCFGAGDANEHADGDLLVAVDTFADFLHALENGIGAGAPMDPHDAFAATHNPLVYPERLRRWLDLASRAPRLCVVDLSDAGAPREVAFEALPQATLLFREQSARGGPWQPFPYLYNNVLLAVEHLHAEHEWWRPSARRSASVDWTFCGTLHHPRYGDRRLRALATANRRWPTLRGHVAIGAPFVEVLHLLQSTRYCLDLPGAGELCFRLHEALALGTPLLRLGPGRVELPAGLAGVVTCDPERLAPADAETVRDVYRGHYAPRAAAAALLRATQSQPGAGGSAPTNARAVLV